MRIIPVIALAVSSTMILPSCEKDFVIEEQHSDPKMVINCNLDDLSNIIIFVSESFAPNGNAQVKSINDATVELYRNDTYAGIIPFMMSDSGRAFGRYELQEKPVQGVKYSIRASHPKYGMATAEDVFPVMPDVTDYELMQYGNRENSYISQFRIRFRENSAQENYYKINTWQDGQHYTVVDGDTVLDEYIIGAFPVPVTALPDTAREYKVNLLFSDKSFNGEEKEIIIEFKTIDLHNVKQGRLFVILGNISKANYDYHTSLNRHQTGDIGTFQPEVFGNINNGYGIFMGQCIYRMIIPVK